MHTAPYPAEPTRQTHQGVGARILRRLGGAVRGAIAGISRVGKPRAARLPETPARTRRPRLQRQPDAAPPSSPAKPGWFARWFGLTGRRTAASPYPTFTDDDPTPFTPERFPELSPQACAVLNTPVDECPPEILCFLLSWLAQHIADSLPPELGLSDPQAIFSTLWDRLAAARDDAGPDATPAQPPDEAPAAPVDVASAAPAEAPAVPMPASVAVTAEAAAPAPGSRPIRPAWIMLRSRSVFGRLLRHTQPCRPRRHLYYACAGPP